jgi:hypothetical protein
LREASSEPGDEFGAGHAGIHLAALTGWREAWRPCVDE